MSINSYTLNLDTFENYTSLENDLWGHPGTLENILIFALSKNYTFKSIGLSRVLDRHRHSF